VIVDFGVSQIALLQTLGDKSFNFRLLLVGFVIHTGRRGIGTNQYSYVLLF
jgi:hypothetical protein